MQFKKTTIHSSTVNSKTTVVKVTVEVTSDSKDVESAQKAFEEAKQDTQHSIKAAFDQAFKGIHHSFDQAMLDIEKSMDDFFKS